MTKKLFGVIASLLGLTAVLFVSTGCLGGFGHRPEVPAELMK